ncbi:MAG: type II toxin-antitoxin system RelE/ParE family toxin [Acidobacteriota bacterium]
MKAYRFLEDAEAEFQEHIRYFDEQSVGLGDKFIADVEAVLRRIRDFPKSGSPISRNVRKSVLRIFKYNLLYVNEPEEIMIVAVAPHKRRPGYWRKRLRNLRR